MRMAFEVVILRLHDGKLPEPVFCRSNNPTVRLRRDAITCAWVRLEMPEASSPMLTSRLWWEPFSIAPQCPRMAWSKVASS